jgi:hypothetical protein
LLSVDTFNVSLYGANAPYEIDRKQTILPHITARTSDIMCLLEVSDLSDRQLFVQAGQMGRFPNSYMIDTNETTPPSNPIDVRPTPSTPPCGGVDLSSVLSCVENNCSTAAPGVGTGSLNGSTNCLSANCTAPFGPLYFKNHYCFDCLVYYLTSLQQFDAMKTACTQDPNPPFAFVGQTPSMILSHYPLKNTQAYILPASGFRRAVLKAQVELEDQTVDFFCGQLSSPLIKADLPYTGYYGMDTNPTDGGAPENGWEDEQDHQAQEAIQWMVQQADADGLPAIIAGDWHSSVPCTAGADAGIACSTTLNALSPEVNTTLTTYKSPKSGKSAVRADPPNYVHPCDYCAAPTNSYNTGIYSYEWTPTYIYGFPNPTGSAVSETLWDTDNIVTIPEMNGMMAPIAEAYPRNVQLIRPR